MTTLSIEELAQVLQPRQAIAGLDLGTKTIGLSMSDLGLRFATPRTVLKRVKFTQDAETLLAFAAKENVAAFIIGLPMNMDGSEGPRSQSSRAYARNLSVLGLPILLWDERWSTASATSALIAQDFSRAKRAERIDSAAAAVILQAAIDALAGGYA